MSHSAYTGLSDVAADRGLPQASRRPLWLRASNARIVAEVGRAWLVWLAVTVVCAGQYELTARALAAITAAAAIWVVAQRAAASSELALFGRFASDSFGTALGLVPVALVNDSSVGLRLSWPWLCVAGLGVLATLVVWDSMVEVALAGRRRVLLVGDATLGSILPEDIRVCRRAGFEIVGASAPRDGSDEVHARVVPLAGGDELARVVEAQQPDILVVTDDHTFEVALAALLDARASVRLATLTSFCEHAFGRVPIEHVTPAWFLSLVHMHHREYGRRAKRAFDVVVAGLGLLLAAPLLVLLGLLTKMSPGPILHRQVRVGEAGRPFVVNKLRTMRCDAEYEGAAFACDHDPRVTRVGLVLRRTHLDELPQLWNVLKGEMSMVGPRPERPEFIDMIEAAVPFWSRRVLVKPGLTGWAQIRGDYASDCSAMATKLSYDLWYLRHGSLLVDLAVCAMTPFAVLRSRRR